MQKSVGQKKINFGLHIENAGGIWIVTKCYLFTKYLREMFMNSKIIIYVLVSTSMYIH